jgi:hypothetical protein
MASAMMPPPASINGRSGKRSSRRGSTSPDQPCDAVDRLARRQLKQVERRLARLTMLKSELVCMPQQCAGGAVRDCRMIEALSDHSAAVPIRICRCDHAPECGATAKLYSTTPRG